MLTLLAFDGAVLINNEPFRQIVQRSDLAENIALAHVIFLLLGLVFWDLALRYSEPSLKQAHAGGGGADHVSSDAFAWYVGWLLLLALLILHFTFYMLKTDL